MIKFIKKLMNIQTYNLNDKVLYRKHLKYRFELYTIHKLLDNNILELINNYDNIVQIDLKTKYKNIQKYIQYDETKEIYCDIFDKKYLIFSFNCDYCNIIHKHNKLGHQDCKCNCSYSPYYKNGYILICGQLPWDTQVQDIDYNKWLNDLFIKLKKTNKKIVYRNHPLYKPRGKHIITVPDFITMDENEKLIDSIKNAYWCLSYNSTSLVEAIIEGCPIIPYSKMSVVYNLSSKDINNLYIPSKKEIYQTMCNISYIQYTEEEWSNGVAFNYIKTLL